MVKQPLFMLARPVWIDGVRGEYNVLAGFRAAFQAQPDTAVSLHVAACTAYRAWLNGCVVAAGPARTAHGYARVDVWPLPRIKAGINLLAIEVAGYGINAYACTSEPPFLQAEIRIDGTVIAATGDSATPFETFRLIHRVQRVQRYSFQRTFVEVYRMNAHTDDWYSRPGSRPSPVSGIAAPPRRLLKRQVPLPRLTCRQPVRWVSSGRSVPAPEQPETYRPRYLVGIGPTCMGFPENNLEAIPSRDLQHMRSTGIQLLDQMIAADQTTALPDHTWRTVDFGVELTGFPGAVITCRSAATIRFVFDELLTDGEVDFKRLDCVNVITWHLEPGTYRLESFEPYSMRYLKILAQGSDCMLGGIFLRELAAPHVYEASFTAARRPLNQLFEAARNTFRQNAVDLFMDCPSRERAGWLGDSFFTARVERDLTGQSVIETNFLENFLLAGHQSPLPDGMLPMCYPADHPDGVFIPNWAMWFVLQLEEYAVRETNPRLVRALFTTVRKLLAYLERFRNAEGLLENLESWVFIEWSRANDFVKGVNIPSNLLYAGMLDAAGRLYQDAALRREAASLRTTIQALAFDGEWFVDQLIREGPHLVRTSNRTETCQYFAFYFDAATPRSHPGLWSRIESCLGPCRAKRDDVPDIHPANAFMGNYLRLELLSRHGRPQQILDEILPMFLPMAEQTGTLWEHMQPQASCNHGFASHLVRILYRDILGCTVDPHLHQVTLRVPALTLDWCEGRLPLPDGCIEAGWWKEGDTLHTRLLVPAGYRQQVILPPAAEPPTPATTGGSIP